jgi:hypothetical protein
VLLSHPKNPPFLVMQRLKNLTSRMDQETGRTSQSFLLPAQGIGSEPGKVSITFGAATFDCPVERWTTSSLQARVAAVPLTAAAEGSLVIALADGRVAASIPVRVAPAAEPAAGTQAALSR